MSGVSDDRRHVPALTAVLEIPMLSPPLVNSFAPVYADDGSRTIDRDPGINSFDQKSGIFPSRRTEVDNEPGQLPDPGLWGGKRTT